MNIFFEYQQMINSVLSENRRFYPHLMTTSTEKVIQPSNNVWGQPFFQSNHYYGY